MDKFFAFVVCLYKIVVIFSVIAYFREDAWENRMKESDAIMAQRRAETDKQIAAAGERVKREMMVARLYAETKATVHKPLRTA